LTPDSMSWQIWRCCASSVGHEAHSGRQWSGAKTTTTTVSTTVAASPCRTSGEKTKLRHRPALHFDDSRALVAFSRC
jgi:hypothetical protein